MRFHRKTKLDSALTTIASPTNTATTIQTTLVLLDPTSHDGESALSMLDATDENITLLVLLSGPASPSLRDFARSENIDVSTAGWRYLDQVVERVEFPPEQLFTMVVGGPSAAAELAEVAATRPVRRVLLPSSVDRLEPGMTDLLAACVDAPVLTAAVLTRIA